MLQVVSAVAIPGLTLLPILSFAQFMKEDGGKDMPGYILEINGKRQPATIHIAKGKGTIPAFFMLW